jgi:DNA-binding NarL/FixJ family response regulator
VPNNSEPQGVREFERDTAVSGTGSPPEQVRVLRRMRRQPLSDARRQSDGSMTMLDTWRTGTSARAAVVERWAKPKPGPVVRHAQQGRAAAPRAPGGLSPRQLEIAALIRQGLTNAEIAARLVLSPGTVANHVANILDRLNLRSRTQVAVWAAEHGLGGHRPR